MKISYTIVLFLAFWLPSNAQQNPSLEKMLTRMIYTEVEMKKIPGMVVGVIDRDGSYVYGFKETVKGNGKVPDANTVWEIGSISKVFTACLLSIMVSEGTLSYDTPADEYLDGINLQRNGKKITIRQLVSHTAGLPKLPFNFGANESSKSDPYASYSKADLLEFLSGFNFMLVKDEYQYSHVGFALLAVVLETAGGAPFPQLIEEKLLKPLQMTDTRIDLSLEQEGRMAQGYSLLGDPATPWNFQVFAGAIGYKSSAADLMKLLAVFLEDTHLDLGKTLGSTLIETSGTSVKRVWMAQGWHIIKPKKRFYNVYAHSGVTDGFRAYIGFVKESHTATVVLTNTEETNYGIGSIVLQVLNKNWKR